MKFQLKKKIIEILNRNKASYKILAQIYYWIPEKHVKKIILHFRSLHLSGKMKKICILNNIIIKNLNTNLPKNKNLKTYKI